MYNGTQIPVHVRFLNSLLPVTGVRPGAGRTVEEMLIGCHSRGLAFHGFLSDSFLGHIAAFAGPRHACMSELTGEGEKGHYLPSTNTDQPLTIIYYRPLLPSTTLHRSATRLGESLLTITYHEPLF